MGALRQYGGSRTELPRAFAVGTGFAFQTAGSVLVALAVIVWIISEWAVARARRPAAQWTDYLSGEHLPAALLTILLLASFVGGMAMIALGVGLQGERKSSGAAAMVVSGLLATCYIVVATMYLVAAQRYLAAILIYLLAVPFAVLFLLAGHSASILRRFPPPPDMNAATPELLEEIRQKKLERLKNYDS